MTSLPRYRVLSDRIFILAPERVVAVARLILTVFALVAIFLDPPQDANDAQIVYVVISGYLAFAVLSGWIAVLRSPAQSQQLIAHTVDIVCVCLLMHFNQGPNSPFFIFFTFILLSATLRWGWRGAAGTTALLVVIFLTLILMVGSRSLSTEIDELSRSIIRPAYLVVAGIMLSYVGALQERSRLQLTKLAAWPGPDHSPGIPVPIKSALAHAGDILRAPRVLLIWEPVDEPFRDVALWSGEGIEYTRERPGRFGDLVAPALADQSFSVRIEKGATELFARSGAMADQPLDPDLQHFFSIRSTISAPFSLPACKGRIFLLDAMADNNEGVLVAELIATRIGIDLEHYWLRSELEEVARSKERERLARDLHDGVLQGLAAANIQLRLSSDQADSRIAEQISETRQVLAAEQQRIRTFVERSRSQVPPSFERVDLAADLDRLLSHLGHQWKCRIDVAVEPPNVWVEAETARNVRHFLAEAVSNAVRHGKASQIDVRIRLEPRRLSLSVADDGNGFEHLNGTYSGEVLSLQNWGPLSLRTRAEDMGGTIALRTSPAGTAIHLEVPL